MVHVQLRRSLVELCDDVQGWIGEPGVEAIERTRATVDEALRVAVVGRVKAGKSTLVNALISRRIAPTAATECTRVVTSYQYGALAKAEIVLANGGRQRLPFENALPDTLDVPLEAVERIEVQLPEHRLRGLTVIDTPGLASLTRDSEAATRAAVLGERASRRAAGDVDAIIYVFRDTERGDDIEFVRSFTAATADRGAAAMNAIGVLSRADEFGSGAYGDEDPVDSAATVARRIAAEHAELLSDVVPVVGLLAETARTGLVTESDAAALSRLASLDDQRLRLWHRFEDDVHAAGVTSTTMRSLLSMLGPYGLRHARAHTESGAESVYDWCAHRSGIDRLEHMLAERFTRRGDTLKATHILAELERVTLDRRIDAAVRRRLADRIEQARLHPDFHPVRELRATEMLRRQKSPHADVLERLERFLSCEDVAALPELPEGARGADLHRAVLEQATWATGIAANAAPDLILAQAGQVLARSYLLLAQRLCG